MSENAGRGKRPASATLSARYQASSGAHATVGNRTRPHGAIPAAGLSVTNLVRSSSATAALFHGCEVGHVLLRACVGVFALEAACHDLESAVACLVLE